MSLFEELKRRNVVRVGVAYVVIGWVTAQIAEFAFENFGAPEWVLKSIVVILLLGLPIALFFAWAFELTPDGVKLEKDVDRSESITSNTGRKLDRVIIAALVLALAYFFWDRQPVDVPVDSVESAAVAEVVEPAEAEQQVTAGPDPRSIAVLPFVNMSSDEEQEWFSDGLTEEILNSLARTPDLLVSARTSSFKFKGSVEDVPTIAASLGVAHILEGSVRSSGDQLRVTAQLIRASDGFHLWSQTYDRDPEEVIAIQEEIAIEIATALETAMDPEALANMVSSGTSSVAAFNAYLQGLAYGASTLSTGDVYTFLGARDGFERAIELDPEFSMAYWQLSRFWRTQMSTTDMVAGIVEIPLEEMVARFDEAIDKAIATERDPINQLRFRAWKAARSLRLSQALRLISEYLEHRPNDQDAQNSHLRLLADLSMDIELAAAIRTYQERDGYNVLVTQSSLTHILTSNDSEFIRDYAKTAQERIGDNTFFNYQAHRALLWTGDIDGASKMLRLVMSSDLSEQYRQMVALRQSCGEGRISDATRIFDDFKRKHSDDYSTMWLSHMIMNQPDRAYEFLMELDDADDLDSLADFLAYAQFDARRFPNLMSLLDSQGVTPREPLPVPYSCTL
jgi:TolB-like protein